MKASDIDQREINEAFAGVVLQTIDALKIDPARVNVNGGSIALGHLLGTTGTILVGTALDELKRTRRSESVRVSRVASPNHVDPRAFALLGRCKRSPSPRREEQRLLVER